MHPDLLAEVQNDATLLAILATEHGTWLSNHEVSWVDLQGAALDTAAGLEKLGEVDADGVVAVGTQ